MEFSSCLGNVVGYEKAARREWKSIPYRNKIVSVNFYVCKFLPIVSFNSILLQLQEAVRNRKQNVWPINYMYI